ncbi:LysR family transcriptional regulator [Caenimonas soli]|jgi:DNA-binding transcriptional LysR family regulator|uniref:LysR family transcriptional regulator n=1 Tax=Caenimonas soli TaxID=2735555 RepID=UPI001557539C|nr:LysR family transcriptional regulator [Caenimonas soli]NPC56415.1 LysR family transcriptional regulator [Caenimonas soli]
MTFELRHLRYFLAVADTGHVTRAAEQLGIQQPPLSIQIRALEKQLGLPLFHRRPRGMELTDGGRLFLADARRILADVAATQHRMERVARGEQGELAIGFTSSAAAHTFTPEALRVCRKEHPDIHLDLSEHNAAELTEALAAAKLHCALLRVPVARPEGIAFETLLREPVAVALPIDHPLARKSGAKRVLALDELREESFILVRRPGAPGLYGNLIALCEERGFHPRIAAEVDRMMTNVNLVAAGAGISIVPASMQGMQPDAVAYFPLAESARLDAPLTLAWREADFTGPTKTFIGLLRKIARRYRPGKAMTVAKRAQA